SICLAQVDISLSEPGTIVNVRLPDASTIQAKGMSQMSAVDAEGTRLDNDTVAQSMVTFAEPVARGPVRLGAATTRIGEWEVSAQPSTAALALEHPSALAKIEVRSQANGAGAINLHTQSGRTYQPAARTPVIVSGPGQWLGISEIGSQASALADLPH